MYCSFLSCILSCRLILLTNTLLIFRADRFSAFWDSDPEKENPTRPQIVSDVAAASFIPHSSESSFVRKLLTHSSQFYAHLSKTDPKSGVVLRPGVQYVESKAANSAPWYSDLVFNVTRCHPSTESSASAPSQNLATLPSDKPAGWKFDTYLIEPRFFIAWLQRQLETCGVTFEKRHLSNLSELTGYDAIIDCAGMGAKELVNDSALTPIPGHVLILRHTGLNFWMRDISVPGTIGYVYPQRNYVVVGGTKSDEGTKDEEVLIAARLKTKGQLLLPETAQWPVYCLNRGERPGRDHPCVEVDISSLISMQQTDKNVPLIVHNYGHSGEGYCLAPGCATYVTSLVVRHLRPTIRRAAL